MITSNHIPVNEPPTKRMKRMKRILFIDYARVFALFLVVFAHLYSATSAVRLYIYAFHMPLFFLISGYLHRNANTWELTIKMSKKMLIPFGFFLLIGYLYGVLTSGGLRLDLIRGSINGTLYGRSIPANGVIWFLLAMFTTRIIGNILIKYPKVAAIPILILFVYINYHKINTLFLGSALMAIPFYLSGHYMGGVIRVLSTCRYNLILSIVFLAVSILISKYNGKVSMMWMSYGNTSIPILSFFMFYLNGLIGSLFVLCAAGACTKESRIVNVISISSISIVGVQAIPILAWIHYLGINQDIFLSMLYSMIVIALCVLFHIGISRKLPWLLGGE